MGYTCQLEQRSQKKVSIGNNVSVAANSVVLSSFDDNVLLAGMPAQVVRLNYTSWYERDNLSERVNQVEELKNKMNI